MASHEQLATDTTVHRPHRVPGTHRNVTSEGRRAAIRIEQPPGDLVE
jgi:hypothetical protein